MDQKMLPNDETLYYRVEEIVHFIWDPIGISEIPEARDEYHSYMTAIFGRVKSGNEEDIIEYMQWAVTENMGMSFDEKKARKAAKVMLKWKELINENT